jgi:hypothetical protein
VFSLTSGKTTKNIWKCSINISERNQIIIVLEEYTTSIFSTEDGGNTILNSIGNHLLDYMASLPSRSHNP